MKLKAIEQTTTGLNTMFVNEDSGRRLSLDHVINQIRHGNKNYDNYQIVENSSGTTYVRSKPDSSVSNNIE